MISARFGWPLDADSADRAMARDSLGMGGKNPSIRANRYIPRYTKGEAASARIQLSTGHRLRGRLRSTRQARDPTDLTASPAEYVLTHSGSHLARSCTSGSGMFCRATASPPATKTGTVRLGHRYLRRGMPPFSSRENCLIVGRTHRRSDHGQSLPVAAGRAAALVARDLEVCLGAGRFHRREAGCGLHQTRAVVWSRNLGTEVDICGGAVAWAARTRQVHQAWAIFPPRMSC